MRKQVTLADGRRGCDVVFKRAKIEAEKSDCRETRLRENRIESTYLLTTFSRLKPETDIIATYL